MNCILYQLQSSLRWRMWKTGGLKKRKRQICRKWIRMDKMDKHLIRIHNEAATSRYSARCRTVSTLIRSTHSQGLFWLRLEAKAYRSKKFFHCGIAPLLWIFLYCQGQFWFVISNLLHTFSTLGKLEIRLHCFDWVANTYPFEVAFQGSIPSKRFEDCTMKMLGPQWQDTMRRWNFSRKKDGKRQWFDFTIHDLSWWSH